MRLADFLDEHAERVLEEWDRFAQSLWPAGMDLAARRDHANAMLAAIAHDLRTPQSDVQQSEKGRGRARRGTGSAPTAAEEHGAHRAAQDVSLEQMVAEYRALRASVIRLWGTGDAAGDAASHQRHIEDLTRFNEAVDQALAESAARFSRDLERSKDMFLAILGHDLRTPLGAVVTSAGFMATATGIAEPYRALASKMVASGLRMNQIVTDLLDFTRTRLGDGIPITRAATDLGAVCTQTAEEVAAFHPANVVQCQTSGELRGQWDGARIGQAVSNLVANAVQHGAHDSPVRVAVRGEAGEVVIAVHNEGPPIPPHDVPGLFNPLKHVHRDPRAARQSQSLGLGLYIAQQIAAAHGGVIAVESSADAGTTFTMRLPRGSTAEQAPGPVVIDSEAIPPNGRSGASA
jgi:signal transduction histidine kinase